MQYLIPIVVAILIVLKVMGEIALSWWWIILLGALPLLIWLVLAVGFVGFLAWAQSR